MSLCENGNIINYISLYFTFGPLRSVGKFLKNSTYFLCLEPYIF